MRRIEFCSGRSGLSRPWLAAEAAQPVAHFLVVYAARRPTPPRPAGEGGRYSSPIRFLTSATKAYSVNFMRRSSSWKRASERIRAKWGLASIAARSR